MQVRLASDILSDSIVDGEGLRTVIWTQGCRRACPGCHNPETWSLSGGILTDTQDIKTRLATIRGQAGLTFSGGEPFLQAAACADIATFARSTLGWSIWSFTGFTYEDLISAHDPDQIKFLRSLDVLIDGPFILAQRDISLRFRGSRNQRLLHLKNGKFT